MVAIDLSGAFDTVHHETLFNDIAELPLHSYLTRFLFSYLRGRQTYVKSAVQNPERNEAVCPSRHYFVANPVQPLYIEFIVDHRPVNISPLSSGIK